MNTDDLIQQVRKSMVADYPSDDLLLLQYLQTIQQSEGYIDKAHIDWLAEHCGLSPSDIDSVISFYSFLTTRPAADFRILISDNIVDRMQGSRELLEDLLKAFAATAGENSAGDLVRIDTTSCTGMSDQGPAALINGQAISLLDKPRRTEIIDLIRQGKAVELWPQSLRQPQTRHLYPGRLLGETPDPGCALQASTDPQRILQSIEQSGLRGRGGAGFPTARKWRFCQQNESEQHVVVCNADEGEPGTFKDRHLLQYHADEVIEGMTLCARVINARQGFIYLRGEYRHLLPGLLSTLQKRRDTGLLGKNILGIEGFSFDIDIHLGAGAYVCGEESALLESLEGRAGIPRNRPPFPVQEGYRKFPTVVNNVETFLAATHIILQGADWFRQEGTEQSAGSKILSISGDCERPGIYEIPFGITLGEILTLCGANDTAFVQVGGAAGRTLPPSAFSSRLCFEDVATAGSFMIFNQQRSLFDAGQNFCDFFVHESCGFCTPCRVGTSLQADLIRRLAQGEADQLTVRQLHEVNDLLHSSSHCGLGASAGNFFADLKQYFPEVLKTMINAQHFPEINLQQALHNNRLQERHP